MKFFNAKDLAKSWSVWAASVVTVVPVVNENSEIFNIIPEKYKPYAITILGIIVLITRAIKQNGLSKDV